MHRLRMLAAVLALAPALVGCEAMMKTIGDSFECSSQASPYLRSYTVQAGYRCLTKKTKRGELTDCEPKYETLYDYTDYNPVYRQCMAARGHVQY